MIGRSLIAAAALASLLAGCAAPIPTLKDFDHFNEQYDNIIAPDIAELDQKLASGEISQEKYDLQIAKFEEEKAEKVNNLVRFNHQLWESYYRNLGIPTPRFGYDRGDGSDPYDQTQLGGAGEQGAGEAGYGSQAPPSPAAPQVGRWGTTRVP